MHLRERENNLLQTYDLSYKMKGGYRLWSIKGSDTVVADPV